VVKMAQTQTSPAEEIKKLQSHLADIEHFKTLHAAGQTEVLKQKFDELGWNKDVIECDHSEFCTQMNMCKHDVKSAIRSLAEKHHENTIKDWSD